MAGTEMKNTVLIALVVLVTLFVVYQYDPSFFGLLRSREGFQGSVTGKSNSLAQAHGNAPPGNGVASPGKPQKMMNSASPPTNPVAPGDAQSKNAFGNGLKVQPPSKETKEKFADLSAYEGPANFGAAEAPAGCYPRDQLTPSELLPKDMNSIWAEQNPMGPGSLKGKNFLSAGALIGVNTVGQSLRNANLQVRSEPPNPQVPVSIFNQSTIAPDISHRPLEIGA
jgi:hypothetical protein